MMQMNGAQLTTTLQGDECYSSMSKVSDDHANQWGTTHRSRFHAGLPLPRGPPYFAPGLEDEAQMFGHTRRQGREGAVMQHSLWVLEKCAW